jgi:HEXXH motif-containing protein
MSAVGAGTAGLTLPARVFDELSAGYGDEEAMRILRAGQRTRRRLLLRAIHDTVEASRGWIALLMEVDAKDSAAVEHILAHPLLERWALLCLNGKASVAYLGSLAASAALRAGSRFEISLPVRQGSVTLPTLGTVCGLDGQLVTLSGKGDRLAVHCGRTHWEMPWPPSSAMENWRPATVVRLGGHSLAIEDADPHRDCFGYAVTGHLPAGSLNAFVDRLTQAWAILESDHPEHMHSMLRSLRMIVPLEEPSQGRSVSSSAAGAFGAVAVSLLMPPEALALQILHEYMHMKLWALLDLVKLHENGGMARHFAPWRSDPRTVPALLQGAYAHVGVTDFWRIRRHVAGPGGHNPAELQFAFWLEQTRASVETLLASGELTEAGDRFVRRLRLTLNGWAEESISADKRRTALDLVTVATVAWRLRNSEPSEQFAMVLVKRYVAGLPPPDRLEKPRVKATPAQGWQPSILDRLIRGQFDDSPGELDDHPAHRAFLEGDFPRAQSIYCQTLLREPGRQDAWCGLAMVLTRTGDAIAYGSMKARPDLVRAVTMETRDDPVAIARWLGLDEVAEPRHDEFVAVLPGAHDAVDRLGELRVLTSKDFTE